MVQFKIRRQSIIVIVFTILFLCAKIALADGFIVIPPLPPHQPHPSDPFPLEIV